MSFEILAAAPGTTIQDRGRPGRLSEAIPPSGPLDFVTHAAANLACGNEAGAAAIEIPLGRLRIRAHEAMLASIDGEMPVKLEAGDELEVSPSSSAVRYLAFAGGIDVPLVLGARATLLVARVGGLEGRALRAGDRLALQRSQPRPSELPPPSWPRPNLPEAPARIDVLPGPHLARLPKATLERLLETEWQISRLGDRVGVRLEGGRVPREGSDLSGPVPMVRGAVQIVTDGTPIVLGPDHPTTGGYPVALVLRRDAQAAFARLRPGATLRFVV